MQKRLSTIFAGGVVAIMDAAAAWAQAVPPLTNNEPAPGLRVRRTIALYAGEPIHHALYLPTDWQAGQRYPVLVEYAPNFFPPGNITGEVEDTHMGFYQSGGVGYIWVSMPFVDDSGASVIHPVTWWGAPGGPQNPAGAARAAEYTRLAVLDIIENYGGDHANVFLTGFSRGAVGCGYVGLADAATADIWAGFLPYSHHDGVNFTPDPGSVRLSRIAGRPSFIGWGQFDSGRNDSMAAAGILTGLGFPVETLEVPGIGHVDNWITTPSPSRDAMRAWLAAMLADNPGTFTVSGRVVDLGGVGQGGVRIQSGLTHWTETDADGYYDLHGLIGGARVVVASRNCTEFAGDTLNVAISGADLANQDFLVAVADTGPQIADEPDGATVCSGADVTFSVAADGAAPLQFQWRKDGDDIDGATTATLALAGVQAGDAGAYDCVVSNDCGTAISQVAMLAVSASNAIVDPPAGKSALVGETVVLTCVIDGPPPVAIRWLKDGDALADGPGISGATTLTLTLASVGLSDSGAYRVEIDGVCGDVLSDPADVAVSVRRADVNCDGAIDFFDIDPFILALFDPAGYAAAHPDCLLTAADVDGSATVDFFDIDPFVDCLFNGACGL